MPRALALCRSVRNVVCAPHSAIGNIAPFEYAKLNDPAKQRDGSLELFEAPRPVPLHNRAGAAQTVFGLNSLTG
jgi:hypothetical protein